MIAKIQSGLSEFFLKASTGEVLSALRFVVGLMVLLKGLFLYPHIDDLYGQYGYLQSALMAAVSGGNLSSLSLRWGVTPEIYSRILHVFFIFHLLAAFSFMIGHRTKLSNICLWATQTMLFQLAWVSAYGIDSYSENLAFMMLWLPVGRYFSVDAKLKPADLSPTWICTLGLRCIQIYVLMTYVDAGLSKAMGSDWWDGRAIWEVLHLPEFNHMNFFWMADYQIVPKVIGWFTVCLESLYIVGYWIPYVGRFWVLAIIGMHLFIATMMGLPLFGITLALVNTVLFLYSDSGVRGFLSRSPLRLRSRVGFGFASST